VRAGRPTLINPGRGDRGVPPEEFENVFAPFVREKSLNAEQILLGIRAGAILPESLPSDAQRAVDAELKRRTRDQATRSMLPVLLGTLGETKHKTRLQSYLFLADRELARRRGREPARPVYDWKPHPHGPFSESLDTCIEEAIADRTVEEFTVRENGKDEGVGYRLTGGGREKFSTMTQTLEGASLLIRDLLARFQGDSTERPLLEFVHGAHPEYATKGAARDKLNRPLDAA